MQYEVPSSDKVLIVEGRPVAKLVLRPTHETPNKEVGQKNLFSVSDCKMYWQSNGEYLAHVASPLVRPYRARCSRVVCITKLDLNNTKDLKETTVLNKKTAKV